MTTVLGADSWWEPDAQQIATAKANGVGAWLGYFKQGNDGIYGNGWSDATFQAVKAAGLLTAAYCGNSDPAWVKARAASLGITAILDVEPSVLGNAWANAGQWDQWMRAAGAGAYGSGPRYGATNVATQHLHCNHPCLVVSDYESGIGGYASASWPAGDPRPDAPTVTGWQYAGSQGTPYGTVDLGIYDAAVFTGATDMQASDAYGAAQVSLFVILGHAPSQDEVTQMENDIIANGWSVAFTNAAARAQSGGEIPASERLTYLQMDGNSGAPKHSHPSTSTDGASVTHTHDFTVNATGSGTSGPPK